MEQLRMPSKIRAWADKKPFMTDAIGMSGSQVLIFEEMVLKIGDDPEAVKKQIQMMQWLEGKLPVPRVLEHEEENGKSYLLMSKMGGEMSCAAQYLEQPEVLLEALAQGMKLLWEVDTKDCPRLRDPETLLKEAGRQLEEGQVDLDNVEPETFGENGFADPEELLKWLGENRPPFEPVFSHGDFCLPNIFLENGRIKGFIDLDRAGICDKWNDIALCYRSLKHNFDGSYGGKVYGDFQPKKFFEILGIEPNWEKIRWYLLLDELF